MKIFAMDTSTLTATVAVLDEDKVMGEYTLCDKLTHSQTIMPMTDEILKKLNITLRDIDVFSVCVGPGSFTGLRIGMATVKTFSQALSKPIIGVSSLDAIAYNICVTDDTLVCPMIDARRNEVYNAIYQGGSKVVADRALHIDELLCELRGKKVVFCGDGAVLHRELIGGYGEKGWSFAPPNLILSKASSVAYSALKKAHNSEFDDAFTLNPVYLRKSQAEREMEEKNK